MRSLPSFVLLELFIYLWENCRVFGCGKMLSVFISFTSLCPGKTGVLVFDCFSSASATVSAFRNMEVISWGFLLCELSCFSFIPFMACLKQ